MATRRITHPRHNTHEHTTSKPPVPQSPMRRGVFRIIKVLVITISPQRGIGIRIGFGHASAAGCGRVLYQVLYHGTVRMSRATVVLGRVLRQGVPARGPEPSPTLHRGPQRMVEYPVLYRGSLRTWYWYSTKYCAEVPRAWCNTRYCTEDRGSHASGTLLNRIVG